MRKLSRLEKLLFPTALLSSVLGFIIAPSSVGPLGGTAVCAAETCEKADGKTCVTENGSLTDYKASAP
jgi:hypothetical protein